MSNIIQRGADVPISCTSSVALDQVDGYAIHLRDKDQTSQTPLAKYSNTATTGYTVRLFTVSAAAGTFTMKLDKTFTQRLKGGATIEGMLYTQSTDTDYTDNDLRPASDWAEVGVATKELIVTATIGA
jgi:predicted dithiol-disulfide oxidoreductase (DUF899 family)